MLQAQEVVLPELLRFLESCCPDAMEGLFQVAWLPVPEEALFHEVFQVEFLLGLSGMPGQCRMVLRASLAPFLVALKVHWVQCLRVGQVHFGLAQSTPTQALET